MSELAVMTVGGPIDPSELGVTLPHDHVLFDGWGVTNSYSSILDDEDLAAAEVRRFKQAGGSAICGVRACFPLRFDGILNRVSCWPRRPDPVTSRGHDRSNLT